MIEETIANVRLHLPDAEIIIQFDGIREQQMHYLDAYNEYKSRMLWKCLHEWKNVLPLIFEENLHQSGMMHRTMEHIKTPLIIYMEHDAPFTPDRPIDFDKCRKMIADGKAYNIRFHFENVIPEPHWPLMIGEPEDGFLKTVQWSQRPMLSTKIYYEQMLSFFPPDSKTFIEDEWHGVVLTDWDKHGMAGWYKHRLWIYYPEGGIQRSYNLDGRKDDPKFGEGFQK